MKRNVGIKELMLKMYRKNYNKLSILVIVMMLFNCIGFVRVEAATGPITFDYEVGVNGFDSKIVTQLKSGETLRAVSLSYNLKNNGILSGDMLNALATDYDAGGGSETSITFTVDTNKTFDLTSLQFGDMSATSENVRITSSKGSVLTGAIMDTATSFNVSAQPNASDFTQIKWFTITALSTDLDALTIDDIALNNIMPTLEQVTGAALSATGVATWDNLSNESTFEVQLYKGGVIEGAPVSKAANVTTHNFLSAMRSAGAGVYTVKVTAIGDGTTYASGAQSAASSGQTVSALSTVSAGLTWTGDVAHWTGVPNAVSYDVQLYNGGVSVGSPVNVLSAAAAAGADFASAITTNIVSTGGGTYTYKVTAIADPASIYFDAAQSAALSNNIKAIELPTVTSVALSASGVASWANIANESGYSVQLYKDSVSNGAAQNKAADLLSHDFLSAMRTAGAGDYTVKVTGNGNGTTYSDSPISTSSETRTIIQPATVSAGLTWTGNVAHWTSVANAVSYDVQLFKGGISTGAPINVLAASASTGADFTAAIGSGGGGTYTFKVTAKGNSLLVIDAVASAFSTNNVVATPLAQVTGAALSSAGEASWDNLSNEINFEVQLYKDGTLQGAAVTKAADATTHDFLSAMRSAGAGVYTVKVTAIGDGTTYSNGAQSVASSGQTISALSAVSAGLTWTGDVAHWTIVANATSYDVQLYNNGVSVGTPVNVLSAAAAAGADFASAITTNIGTTGGGTYTFKVTAKANTATLYLDAPQSVDSSNNIKAIQLAQVGGVALSASGVATWTDVANESSYSIELFKNGVAIGTAPTGTNVTTVNLLIVMKGGGIGDYTVKVTAIGNGSTYSNGAESTASNIRTIVQPTTVTAGTWTGNIAHWTAVANGVSYNVQLYKDTVSTGTPINVLAANVASGADFAAAIGSGGGGTYTFKVTALGDSTLILDGVASAFSADKVVATPLAQVTGAVLSASGVASWNNLANETNFEVQLYKDSVALGSAQMKAADTLTANFLSEMRSSGVGVYTIKVIAKGDGTSYSDGLQSTVSAGQTVAVLSPVSAGLTWTGDVAHWTIVSNAVSYDVQLYKDSVAVGTPVNVVAGSAAAGADFAATIATNGVGTYAYKVTAKANPTTLYLDGAVSVSSDNNLESVQLAQVTGAVLSASGIATWNNVSNETSFSVQLLKNGNPEGAAVVVAANTVTLNMISAMRAAGDGSYTIQVTAIGNGSTYLNGTQSTASSAQLIATLNTVNAGMNWTENTAHFTAVANAVSYDVQLFKDGNANGSPINVLAANAVTGANFTTLIDLNGSGVYTFKVSAKGNSTLLLDANQSGFSENKTILDKQVIPTFTPVAGNITYGTTVTVASAGADAIYYTTDGTNPATSVTGTTLLYSGGIIIDTEKTIKAIAVKSGKANSSIATASYGQSFISDLTDLIMSGNPSNYSFNGATYAYNGIGVANDVSEIVITPTGSATITVEGTVVTTNTSSSAIQLTVGVEKTIIVALNENGKAEKTYTLKVTRSQPSITAPSAPTNIVAVAGNQQVVISFDAPANNGGSAITGYTVVSSQGGITVTGSASPITVTGLTNGTSYVFSVTATNAAGTSVSSANSAATIPTAPETPVTPVTPETPQTPKTHENPEKSTKSETPSTPSRTQTPTGPSGPSGQTAPSTPTAPTSNATGVEIIVNGKVETSGTSQTQTVDNKVVTTVTLDEQKVEARLATEGNNSVITIPINGKLDVAIGSLNGQTVKSMENKAAVLEVKTEVVTYRLPASQIDIDAVSSAFGTQIALKDITVSVKISQTSALTTKVVENTAIKNSYRIVVSPMDFEITCSNGTKEVTVSTFNAYVERLIAIPDNVDPNKITTGIVLNSDGTFAHVPTNIVKVNSKYFAKINSLSNSSYSVIWSPKTFEDTQKHWAQVAIDDMGSRLVVSGVDEKRFEPNRAVTRAEFAEILIKALGLKHQGLGKDSFADVKKGSWYYDSVSIATEYGLLSGYGNGFFGTNDPITREQAITMIGKAMKFTKLNVVLSDAEKAQILSVFNDNDKASSWATQALAANVKAGILSGKNGMKLAPKTAITRAEVAVLIRNLLLKADLINNK